MDIYSAGEEPIPGVNGETLVEVVEANKPGTEVRLIKHRIDVPRKMSEIAQTGDLIITMGAGDITILAPLILEALEQRESTDVSL
jgi:UDP-N-acetylmuramate--alanine ligase